MNIAVKVEHNDITALLSGAQRNVSIAKLGAFEKECFRLGGMAQRNPHRKTEIVDTLYEIAQGQGLLTAHGADTIDRLVCAGLEGANILRSALEVGNATAQRVVVSSSEFLEGFIPPDYLIDGLIQRRFCYSLTAPTGTGKTAVALLLAASVALGRPVGEYQLEQGRVLYLAGENPDDVRMRWIAMSDKMGFDPAKIEAHFLPGVSVGVSAGIVVGQMLGRIAPVLSKWPRLRCSSRRQAVCNSASVLASRSRLTF